jgi:hypothetical protein
MILEKALQKKAVRYASGVSSALNGKRLMEWREVTALIEAAYFNGFQSGVCWQKGELHDGERRVSDWIDALMVAFPGALTKVPDKNSRDDHWFAWNWFLDITSPVTSTWMAQKAD